MKGCIEIDGSLGEGGGQVLRTSLALSVVTGKPLRLTQIRAGRKKPGLMRQHLACVRAAAAICSARTSGVEMGAQTLSFEPGVVRGGSYRFAVGSAGSAILVLQTALPPLLTADAPSELILEGGTHNPLAPPYEFLERSFLPILAQMGAKVETTLERRGYYPAGGGRLKVRVTPVKTLTPVDLACPEEACSVALEAHVSQIPKSIGERELAAVRKRLGIDGVTERLLEVADSPGPGNYLMAEVRRGSHCQVLSAFGERMVPAERLAAQLAKAVKRFCSANVVADDFLADQLLLPMALAGGGSFTTTALSKHTTTNIQVIGHFLPITFTSTRHDRLHWHIETTTKE